MSLFWTLFWLGFLGFPLIVGLTGLTENFGLKIDTSHTWVYKGTKAKVKNATIRDVWENNHPGKSWEAHQSSQLISLFIVLAIAFILFMIWLSNNVFMFQDDDNTQRLLWQIGGPILGGLAGVFFLMLESLITNKINFSLFKALNILGLAAMGIGVIGGLVFTFLKRDLPISHHWLWVPALTSITLWILDSLISSGTQNKAAKGGNKMENWANEVYIYCKGAQNYQDAMVTAALLVRLGEFDRLLRKDKKFFNQTESLMLDLVNGRRMNIKNEEIYKARNEILKAAQTIYFYATENIHGYSVHPKIKAALKK